MARLLPFSCLTLAQNCSWVVQQSALEVFFYLHFELSKLIATLALNANELIGNINTSLDDFNINDVHCFGSHSCPPVLVVVKVSVDHLEVLLMYLCGFSENCFILITRSLTFTVNAKELVTGYLYQSCTVPIQQEQEVVDVRLSKTELIIFVALEF